MPRVLFVCTANRFRSPLAAAFFKAEVENRRLSEVWKISSVGTWTIPGQPATPDAIAFAKENQLSLADHRSAIVTEEILSDQDLILVMESGHKEALINEFPKFTSRIFLLSEAAGLVPFNLPDPYTSHEPPKLVAMEIFSIIKKSAGTIIEKARVTCGEM